MINLTQHMDGDNSESQLYLDEQIYKNDEIISNSYFFAVRCLCEDGFPIESSTNNIINAEVSLGRDNADNLTLSSLIHEKDYNFFYDYFTLCCEKNDDTFFCELRIKTSSYNTYSFLCHVNIIYSHGIASHIECIFVDVSDKKCCKKNIKPLASSMCGNDLCICQQTKNSDNGFTIDFISENIRHYGYSKEQLIEDNMCVFNILNSNHYTIFQNQLLKADKNGSSVFVNTFKIDTENGKTLWVLFETHVFSKNGNILTITNILHDVSEQKNSEKAILDIKYSLTTSLRQSRFITDILKLTQVTSDYNGALKIILQNLSDYASLSSISLLIPSSISSEDCTMFFYNSELSEFGFYKIDSTTLQEKYPNIHTRLQTYGTAYCDASFSSKDCVEELEKIGSGAMLFYSISLANGSAYLFLSDSSIYREWDNETISLINNVSQVLSGLIYRYNTQTQLTTSRDIFKTVLDNISAYVFVSEISDGTIIFSNAKYSESFGEKNSRQIKLESIKRKSYPFFPEDNHVSNSRLKSYEAFCSETNEWLDISETIIKWHYGKTYKMTTMYDISKNIEYEKMIEKQANYDHLTSLPNRRMLERDFPEYLKAATKSNSYGYMLFLDLDNFKNVNDGLGHQYGDALLMTISEYFKNTIFEGCKAYRFGGDEFTIIVPHKKNDKIDFIIDKLLKRFQSKWHALDTSYFCTMSMGIAKFPYDGTSLLDIMKKVDMAMYNAKKLGKNQVLFYKSKIGFDSIRVIEIERYLRESVANDFDGLSVHYQPIIETSTQNLAGAEALLRWHCENLGDVPPSEFIPISERLGLIPAIGDFVLRQACIQCKNWISMGHPDLKMNVNLSVDQLVLPDIIERIKNIITEVGVPFQNIALEVTESIAVNDMKKMILILKDLSALGINISLDDFGTGYSSFNNIKEMPLNTIKIDKLFIDDLSDSSKNTNTEIFVQTIITLAHALGMKVCAEGVEDEAQYKRLSDLKADVIQGYYFSKPMPPHLFEKKYNIK